MTDAEATMRHVIFGAIVDNAPITNDKAEKISDDIFKALTDPTVIWAMHEITKKGL